jgi:hypothetical protein
MCDTAQTVAFIYPAGSSICESIIFADTGVLAAAALSTDNNVLTGYQQWYNFAGAPIPQIAFSLTFLVDAADATTIAGYVPDMITRMATAEPGMTTIETWSWPCTYS